ncbi:MAG: gamma-butyrobetaine hydroxylase-like domain-containing protein [Chlamydiia bacterium]
MAHFVEMLQVGSHTVELRYQDGVVKKIRLNTVQKYCPCKRCSGQSINPNKDLLVSKIATVGRYGLKFFFVSGCSQGIYPHRLLKELPCED